MALSGVIFDLDGTLVDTNSAHVAAWVASLEQHGYRVAPDRIAWEIGKGGEELVPDVLGQEAADRHSEDLRAAATANYLADLDGRRVTVFPRVTELFEALRHRGLKVAVATAAKEEELKRVIASSGLDVFALADAVTTASDVERSKPHPDVVEAACAKLGLSPAQCAMVGDTPYDIRAAGLAGVVCIGVLTGDWSADELRQAGARLVYADVADLLDHLDQALHLSSPAEVSLDARRLERLMEEALEEARRGYDAGEMPAGAVVAASDGRVVARSGRRVAAEGNPLAHASLRALDAAARLTDRAEQGLVLVTTLEPCVMCLGAAIEAGIDTVVYGLGCHGTAEILFRSTGCEPSPTMPRVVGGVLEEECRTLLAAWLRRHPEAQAFRRVVEGMNP